MGLTDLLFGTELDARVTRELTARMPELRAELKEEMERQIAAEATTSGEATYAFATLSGAHHAPGSYELPAAFQAAVIRDSHWMYESHGLAYMIVSRVVSLIFEGGLQYTIEFDEGVSAEMRAAIRKRLDRFWYDEDVDLQDRAAEFVLEVLLSGEHGWRFEADPDNGQISVADLCRQDVEDIQVDAKDRRRALAVQLKGDAGGQAKTLNVLRKDESQHLDGDALYYRLDTRASKRRGSPVLQRVVDELRAEKKFRVMSADRIVQRMAAFVSVTLKNASLDQVKKYAETQPKTIPAGHVWYQNDQVVREYLSASIEAGDISTMIRTFITVIAGAMGMPISWFGFGDGSTKATSETQQEPAAQDSRRMKRGILGVFEKTMYFVLDSAIRARVAGLDPETRIETRDDDGVVVKKLIRDCVTISVAPVPLAKEKADGTPLAATAAAVKLIAEDDLRAQDGGGGKLLTPENEIAIMNYALARDGVGIEVTKTEEKPQQSPAE